MRDRAHPLAVLAWFVLVAGGLGLTLLVGVLRPGWSVAAFVLAFLTWLGGFAGAFVHERWLVALPVAAALALACVGAVEQSLGMATGGGGVAGLFMLLGWLPRRPLGGAAPPPW